MYNKTKSTHTSNLKAHLSVNPFWCILENMEPQGEVPCISKCDETSDPSPPSESWVDVSKSGDSLTTSKISSENNLANKNTENDDEENNQNVQSNINNENNMNNNNNSDSINNIVIDGDAELEMKEDENIDDNGETIEKDIEKALSCKSRGNQFYKLKAYDEAYDEYTNAIVLCPEEKESDKRQLSIFYGNRAACSMALV